MTSPNVPVTRIGRRNGWFAFSSSELWRYRELLWILTLRDISVRYKQTIIGIGWAVIQPVAMMVVFSLIFGRLGKIPSDGIPYPLFSLAALIPWQFFSRAMTLGSLSLVNMQAVLTKVYFPRIIAPLSQILGGIPDFLIALAILIVMLGAYGLVPPITIVMLPAFAALALLNAVGVALLLSGINAKYRDVQFALPLFVQLWMFLSPVIYPTSLLSEPYRTILMLNPMSAVIDGFRWCLLPGAPAPTAIALAISVSISLVVVVLGLIVFSKFERTFADEI